MKLRRDIYWMALTLLKVNKYSSFCRSATKRILLLVYFNYMTYFYNAIIFKTKILQRMTDIQSMWVHRQKEEWFLFSSVHIKFTVLGPIWSLLLLKQNINPTGITSVYIYCLMKLGLWCFVLKLIIPWHSLVDKCIDAVYLS